MQLILSWRSLTSPVLTKLLKIFGWCGSWQEQGALCPGGEVINTFACFSFGVFMNALQVPPFSPCNNILCFKYCFLAQGMCTYISPILFGWLSSVKCRDQIAIINSQTLQFILVFDFFNSLLKSTMFFFFISKS